MGLSQQKRSWQIWSSLYNITVEILHALTIKFTRASIRTRARGMSRARAMAMARAMARTTDRPISLGIGLWLALGLELGLGSAFTFKRLDRFCSRTKFNVTGQT